MHGCTLSRPQRMLSVLPTAACISTFFERSRVQMVHDLFVSTWNKHRTAKNCRPPAPSYSMFVATWTRNFEHVTLKRRPNKPQHQQRQEEGQEHQQRALRPPPPPATCQTREEHKVNLQSRIT